MKELIFISVAPDDLYFSWQYEVLIENMRSLGFTNEIRILLFLPHKRLQFGWNPIWETLEERYKDQNVKFYRYEDKGNVNMLMNRIDYIPLLRPYCLKQHFDEYPELKEKAIFYHDSDIVFTKYVDFSPYLSDDINYLSKTDYINANYFDSKIKDVLPEKLEEYKNLDPLSIITKGFGVTREMCENNEFGGAQYILKNIDSQFWEDVFAGCITIRRFFYYATKGFNYHFFESENKGFQSWCADMWSVLWNLWKRGAQTSTPPMMDFSWATSDIDKWEEYNIFHNAGVAVGTKDLFQKFGQMNEYVNNRDTPYNEDFSYVNKEKCSYLYTKEIEKVRDKYYT